MIKILTALGNWLHGKCETATAEISEAIEDEDWKRAILLTFFFISTILAAIVFVAALTYGIVTNGLFLLKYLGLPLMIVWVIVYGLSTSKTEVIDDGDDEEPTVDEVELIEEILGEALGGGVSESIGLVPVYQDTNLRSPNPCAKLGCCWSIECNVGKRNAAIPADKELIKSVVQGAIERSLKTKNTHGLDNTTYIYHQHKYCILQVAYVIDVGGFVIIGLAWVSDNYFKQGDIRKYRLNIANGNTASAPNDPLFK